MTSALRGAPNPQAFHPPPRSESSRCLEDLLQQEREDGHHHASPCAHEPHEAHPLPSPYADSISPESTSGIQAEVEDEIVAPLLHSLETEAGPVHRLSYMEKVSEHIHAILNI